MHVYRCELALMEATFFSSREVSATHQTEPLIGNIALAYAFGFCRSPYHNDGTIHYKAHLSALNERGLYLTPATIIGQPRFTVGEYNAQPDAYWYAMANNVIVTRPDGAWMEKRGSAWYAKYSWQDRGKKVGLENRPQHGWIRYLALGNQAISFVLASEPVELPRYIRLGKFMSKARVCIQEQRIEKEVCGERVIPFLMNPADLPPDMTLAVCDLISVPPTPLIMNAHLRGSFYQLQDGTLLPAGMRFGVEELP